MEKITLFNVYKFELPLKKPLIVKNNKLNKREGLLINIGISEGLSGFGEISPLPFLHNENIDDARQQVKELKQNNFFIEKMENLFKKHGLFDFFPGSEYAASKDSEAEQQSAAFIKCFNNFLYKLNDLFCEIKVFPSVRAGFEMALISLLFIRPELEKIIKSAVSPDLPVCRLIMDLKIDPEKEILEIITDGYEAVKIKVGRDSVEKEILGIQKIKKLISGKQLNKPKLRIDANGLWGLSEALYFGKAIGRCLIEYIEDPLSNISEYEHFFKEAQIPVALDEKLPDLIDSSKIYELSCRCPDYLKAIVIKPDFTGGFFKTAELIRFARRNGIKPVLSNSFNSSLLISFITLFAGIMHLNDIPLGIDSLSLFGENLLTEDIKIIMGKINILDVLNNIKRINFNLLSPAGF
jgi:o-succinylbenzoate synthase